MPKSTCLRPILEQFRLCLHVYMSIDSTDLPPFVKPERVNGRALKVDTVLFTRHRWSPWAFGSNHDGFMKARSLIAQLRKAVQRR